MQQMTKADENNGNPAAEKKLRQQLSITSEKSNDIVEIDEKKKEVVFKGTPAQIKKQMQNLKKKDKLKIGEEEDLDEKLDKDDENANDDIDAFDDK